MDKIQKGEVKVAFCPRHEMIGNIFTSHCKELFFAWMHAKILNLPGSTEYSMNRSVLENQQIILKESKNNEERAKCKEEEKNQYVN